MQYQLLPVIDSLLMCLQSFIQTSQWCIKDNLKDKISCSVCQVKRWIVINKPIEWFPLSSSFLGLVFYILIFNLSIRLWWWSFNFLWCRWGKFSKIILWKEIENIAMIMEWKWENNSMFASIVIHVFRTINLTVFFA